jgi:hypothetical protein
MERDESPTPWWRLPFWLVLIALMAVAGFFLITEHRAHLFGFLPYLLVLICPAMHFLHHGHGGRGEHGHGSRSAPGSRPDALHQH